MLRSLPHEHVAALLGTLSKLGMQRLLATRPSRQRDLVVAMVVSRVIGPCPNLATCRALIGETKFTTLGEVLNLGEVDEEELC